MKITFFQSNKTNWTKLQVELSDAITKHLACGKDFEVEFRIIDKKRSLRQNSGFWRICGLLVPHFQKEYGQIFDKELVSETVKLSAGYSVKVGKQVSPRSLTKATQDEMNILIEKLYEICEHFGLKGYELTSEEKQVMVRYFEESI